MWLIVVGWHIFVVPFFMIIIDVTAMLVMGVLVPFVLLYSRCFMVVLLFDLLQLMSEFGQGVWVWVGVTLMRRCWSKVFRLMIWLLGMLSLFSGPVWLSLMLFKVLSQSAVLMDVSQMRLSIMMNLWNMLLSSFVRMFEWVTGHMFFSK